LKTDFGVLQSLKVHYYLTASDFRWLAENCRFFSLQTLAIKLSADHEEMESVIELTEAVEKFLPTLPPLRNVKLTGVYTESIVHAVIDLCRQSLRQLLLGSPASLAHGVFASTSLSRLIQEKCPRIEELTLPVMRSQGSADEVATYRSFARMKTLRKLQLSIYVAQSFIWDEDDQRVEDLDYRIEIDESGLAEQLHEAIIDLAIDKTLATSILRTIDFARDSTSQGLETLVIRVNALKAHGGFGSSCDMINLLQYIARSWTCTRNFSGDKDQHYHVTEYDPKDEVLRQTMHLTRRPVGDPAMHVLEPMLNVWPEGRRKGWKEVWHSFPLDENWETEPS
jgi:hypothetical protein